jgi:MFS family permease
LSISAQQPSPSATPRPDRSTESVAARSRRHLRAVVTAPFGGVPGPLPRRIDTSLEDHPTAEQERGMRAFWWDGFWANASESILLNYLGLYILALGASNSEVGLLASMTSLFAALAFIPGARFTEKFGRRKSTVVVAGGGLSRLALLSLAFVPFMAGGSAAIWLVIGIASLRGFWSYFALPAWTSLTADIVPIGIRGRFLASRNFGMGIAALLTAPLAGFLIDQFTGLGGWQLVWLVAFAAGAISTWCYARIPEPEPDASVAAEGEAAAQREHAERGFFTDVLSDRNFVLYLGSAIVWNIALQAAGPFFNVYLVKNLHASTAWVGFIAAIPAFSGLFGALFFGRLMDTRGTKWVMVSSGLLIPVLPLAWVFVTAPWQVVFINVLGGALWAGYHLATTNLVMIMCAPEKRARYAATFQTVTWAAQFVAPLLGGVMIGMLGFHAVFLFSAGGRLLSTLMMMRHLREERPAHPSG